MKLAIRARGLVLTAELRDQVLRRMHFALSRLSPALHRVDVTLADINGPKGGIDKVCRVRTTGPALREVVIEERDAEIATAEDVAAHRAARTVQRTLDRARLLAGRRPASSSD